jgi:hypothetical protein
MSDEAQPAPGPAKAAAPDPKRTPRQRNPLPFIAFVVVLSAAGWYLVSWMADNARLQDCGMSGRKNCDKLDPTLGR